MSKHLHSDDRDHSLYFYRRHISALNSNERALFSRGTRHYHGIRHHAYSGTRLNQEYDFAFRYYCNVEVCHPLDPAEAHGAHRWSRDCRECKSGDPRLPEFGIAIEGARVGALNGRLQVVTAAERAERTLLSFNTRRGRGLGHVGGMENER